MVLGRRMFQVGIQWDTIVLHGVYDDGNILNHQIDAMLTRLFILCITCLIIDFNARHSGAFHLPHKFERAVNYLCAN